MGVQFCNGYLIQLPFYKTSLPEKNSGWYERVSVAQVFKAKAPSSLVQIIFERGSDPCKKTIFFQDEGY